MDDYNHDDDNVGGHGHGHGHDGGSMWLGVERRHPFSYPKRKKKDTHFSLSKKVAWKATGVNKSSKEGQCLQFKQKKWQRVSVDLFDHRLTYLLLAVHELAIPTDGLVGPHA